MWHLCCFRCHRQKNAFGLWGVSEWYCLLLVNKPPACSSSSWNLPSVIRAFTRSLWTRCEMRTCEQLCRAVQQAWTAPLLSAMGHHCGSHCPGVGGVCGPRTLRAALFSVVAASLRCLYRPWSFPGQNTGVGSLSLLQGIFPTQESNPVLLHCRWILYQLSPLCLWSTWNVTSLNWSVLCLQSPHQISFDEHTIKELSHFL